VDGSRLIIVTGDTPIRSEAHCAAGRPAAQALPKRVVRANELGAGEPAEGDRGQLFEIIRNFASNISYRKLCNNFNVLYLSGLFARRNA
jgi:hypothetical protein